MFYRKEQIVPDKYLPKWSTSVLREGFVPFPKRMLRCVNKLFTGPDAVLQLQVVLAIADAKRIQPYWPSTLGFIAFNTGLSENEFEAAHLPMDRPTGSRLARSPTWQMNGVAVTRLVYS